MKSEKSLGPHYILHIVQRVLLVQSIRQAIIHVAWPVHSYPQILPMHRLKKHVLGSEVVSTIGRQRCARTVCALETVLAMIRPSQH